MADPKGFLKDGREVATRRPVEERVQDWNEVYPDGIGRALLSQLFVNLAALQVERVETVVDARNLALLGFFLRAGFGPSGRLAFVKPLA